MDRRNLLLIFGLLLLVAAGPAFGQQMDTSAAVEADVEDTAADSGDTELHFQVGLKAFQSGNLPEAISRLKRSFQGDTGFDRARYWLGHAYYADGRNDSAVSLWENSPPRSSIDDWFERELSMHQKRYSRSSPPLTTDWEYVGVIPGRTVDSTRLTNPSALEPAPGGGWFVASYQLGKVVHYSTEGRILWSRGGFQQPVDLNYVEGLGLLVSNRDGPVINRISDTGAVTTWTDASLRTPERIFAVGTRIYLYDSSRREIIQMSRQGDTIGVIWRAGPRQNPTDVELGPEGKFWILNQSGHELLVLNRYGDDVRRVDLSSISEVRRLWWEQGNLFVTSREKLFLFDVEAETARPVNVSQGNLEGKDVFGLDIYGNQVVLALFQQSGLALYRFGEDTGEELLVQPRRIDVRRFPVIRLNFLLEDGQKSGRFSHLDDGNISIDVENQKVLPGLLRPSRSLYPPRWIMIVDNRFDRRQRWDEIRPDLIDFVEMAPKNASGAVWKSQGEVIQQGFTPQNVLLRNALTRMSAEPTAQASEGDTVLPGLLNTALDLAFNARGPTGVILVSSRWSGDSSRYRRIANRFRNNRVPLILVNPSIDSLPGTHPLRQWAPSRYHDFHQPGDLPRDWKFYDQILRSHYTVVYKSSLNYQQSNARRPYQLIFQYFDRTNRYSGAFLLP